MNILVTGGAGFIASHVVDAYLEAGHQVAVLDNLSTGTRDNVPPGVEFFKIDAGSPEAAQVIRDGGFEVVNHHAAQVSVPFSVEDPVGDLKANAGATLNLLMASAQAGVGRFIFISSGGAVYGEQERLPIAESALPLPASPYAAHKQVGENYVRIFSAEKGLPGVVLRYANVYGPRQVVHAEAGVVAIFCLALLGHEPVTIYRYDDQPGGMVRDYVFVEDVVRANLAALEKGEGGVFNIGTGVPTPTLAVYKAIAGELGVENEPAVGPPRAGDLRNSLLDCSLAKEVLGWERRIDLKQGIKKTIAWYKGSK